MALVKPGRYIRLADLRDNSHLDIPVSERERYWRCATAGSIARQLKLEGFDLRDEALWLSEALRRMTKARLAEEANPYGVFSGR
jgi:hypothetical protein